MEQTVFNQIANLNLGLAGSADVLSHGNIDFFRHRHFFRGTLGSIFVVRYMYCREMFPIAHTFPSLCKYYDRLYTGMHSDYIINQHNLNTEPNPKHYITGKLK